VKVRFTEAALSDIDDIFSYVAARNPQAAVAVVDAIETTAARICAFPYSAVATDEPGIRMAPAGRFPYLIFHTVTADEVVIVRVLHGARQPP
jgi:toxin ParE1/3/4